MKKKLLMYFLMLMLAFSFTACSSDDDDSSSKRSERNKEDEDEDDEDEDDEDKDDKKDKDKDKEKDDEDEKTDDDDKKSEDEEDDDEKPSDEDEKKDDDEKKPSSILGTSDLSDNLFDYQFSIDGVVYTLPMWYSDFEALGWEYDGDEEYMLASEDYDYDIFEKDGTELWVHVTNYSINATQVKDCIVTGVEFEWDEIDEDAVVIFPQNIQLNSSTKDDIIAAYGESDDIYEGSYKTYYYYYGDDEYSYSHNVTFSFDNETGMLDCVEYVNEPDEVEGFDNTLNMERPNFLDEYVAPSELGTELYDATLSLEGDLLTLPCPVTEIEKLGFEIDDYYEIEYIPAGQTFYCYLEKDDKEISVYVKNFSEYATSLDNCHIINISYDSTYHGDVALETSSGIKVGMTEDELLAALGEIEYSLYEGSGYNYYSLYENVWEYSNRRSYTVEDGILTSIEVYCDKSPIE